MCGRYVNKVREAYSQSVVMLYPWNNTLRTRFPKFWVGGGGGEMVTLKVEDEFLVYVTMFTCIRI